MIRSDDPIRDYARYDTEQFFKEMKRPICNDCGNHIMGENLWEFHGLFYCEDCLDNHKVSIDIDYD